MTNEDGWKKTDKNRRRLTDKQGKMGRQTQEDTYICEKTQKQVQKLKTIEKL